MRGRLSDAPPPRPLSLDNSQYNREHHNERVAFFPSPRWRAWPRCSPRPNRRRTIPSHTSRDLRTGLTPLLRSRTKRDGPVLGSRPEKKYINPHVPYRGPGKTPAKKSHQVVVEGRPPFFLSQNHINRGNGNRSRYRHTSLDSTRRDNTAAPTSNQQQTRTIRPQPDAPPLLHVEHRE